MAFDLGAAIQDVLTRGLDTAQQVVQSRYQVNDPTGSVTGPAGNTARIGQSAYGGLPASLGGVPSWVWIAGAVGLALVVVLRR